MIVSFDGSFLRRLCLLFVSLACTQVLASQERYPLETQQQKQWFLELTADLRCPKCQNQNIADSNATVSLDMKRKVHQLLLAGNDKPFIIDYMKQRYGDFVYYQPPINAATIALWFLPLLALLLSLWFFFARRLKPNSDISTDLSKVDALLNEDNDHQGSKP